MTRDGSLYNNSSSVASGNHNGRHSYYNSISGRGNNTYDSMSSSSLHQSRYGTMPVPGNNYNHNSSMSAGPTSIHSYNSMESRQGLNMSVSNTGPASHRHRETIHSGHFMVSDFEPDSEALDDEYEVGMPVPPEEESINVDPARLGQTGLRGLGQTVSVIQQTSSSSSKYSAQQNTNNDVHRQQAHSQPQMSQMPGSGHPSSFNGPISIDGSLTKLFQCMSLAYRQKLTSPKWNPFKGVRLRWKDKIRLNNVIWRCWHMQCTPASKVILRQKALVCQFASPLDVDQHNKPEAVVMEGKYWKRKLSTVAAEYKKWRLFYRNRMMGNHHYLPVPDLHPVSLDGFDWNRVGTFGGGPISNFILDDDLLMDFSDTLFSSLSATAFQFPNPRELSRAGMVADFIQPGLIQLQPNLEDYMDTFEPLQDYAHSKLLPPVPEDLDTMDPPESLLTVDLPNMIQNRMQQTLLSKMNENSQAVNYATSMGQQHQNQLQQQAQSLYYPVNQMNESNRNSSNTVNLPPPPSNVPQPQQQIQSSPVASRSTRALFKDNHNHGQGRSSSGGYTNSNSNSSTRNDVFAVPKGKPRGRSRSGQSNNRQLLQSPTQQQASCPPQQAQVPMAHQQQAGVGSQMGHSHSQMGGAMGSSHTLLSHLLTNSAHTHGGHAGHGGHYSGGMHGKHDNGLAQQQQLMMTTQTNASGVVDLQQHQQAPWNVKNANETLNPNVPLNFGSKALMQVNSSMGMNTGNASPPLLSNTPSPPMGPPGSGPPSPPKQFRQQKPENDRVDNEHRRVCHINAEQKRRCNIKNGFDMLHSLIPQLSHNPNAKVSKAAMLQKGAEYIRQLKSERSALKQEIEAHRLEVEALNSAINNCQSMLPATGAPVSRQRTNKMKEMFDQWVRARTQENWKFWIFSTLIRPLLDSYNNAVSTTSVDELCRTVLAWIDQHCSLVDLRPAVLNSLRYLCTTTDILSNPANLPEEAYKAVSRPSNHSDRGGQGDSR